MPVNCLPPLPEREWPADLDARAALDMHTRESHHSPRVRTHAEVMAEVAARMRARNLTHGTGCRSIARAIEQRTNHKEAL